MRKLFLLFFVPFVASAALYDVRALGGAKGDGITDDTAAFQSTVNAACNPLSGAEGTVHIPKGAFLVGAVSIGCTNLSVVGDGPATSQIYPATNNISVFTVSGSKSYVHFSNILFYNNGGFTGTTGIAITADASHNYPYYAWISDIGCFSMQCFNLDQARMVKVTDIQLVGQAPIFVGSTTDAGPDPYAHDISLSGIHHYPAGASLSGALITVQRGVNVAITNFSSMGLQGTMDGIDFVNDTQGAKVSNMSTVGALNGILARNTTVGSTTVYPQDISVENSETDQFARAGFDFSGAFTITIVGNHFTNFGTAATSAYAVHQGGNDYVINDNTFWISLTTGNGITMDGASQGSQINNNHFTQMGFNGGSCIIINTGSDYYEVQGNTSRARGASAGFISDLANGAHKNVQNTANWPN